MLSIRLNQSYSNKILHLFFYRRKTDNVSIFHDLTSDFVLLKIFYIEMLDVIVPKGFAAIPDVINDLTPEICNSLSIIRVNFPLTPYESAITVFLTIDTIK